MTSCQFNMLTTRLYLSSLRLSEVVLQQVCKFQILIRRHARFNFLHRKQSLKTTEEEESDFTTPNSRHQQTFLLFRYKLLRLDSHEPLLTLEKRQSENVKKKMIYIKVKRLMPMSHIYLCNSTES